MMSKDIFRTVRELLDHRDGVTWSNAVHLDGHLYEDAVENLNALRMLEPSLVQLVRECIASGMESMALDEVIELVIEF
jgi:hypothetical protein